MPRSRRSARSRHPPPYGTPARGPAARARRARYHDRRTSVAGARRVPCAGGNAARSARRPPSFAAVLRGALLRPRAPRLALRGRRGRLLRAAALGATALGATTLGAAAATTSGGGSGLGHLRLVGDVDLRDLEWLDGGGTALRDTERRLLDHADREQIRRRTGGGAAIGEAAPAARDSTRTHPAARRSGVGERR